MTFEVEADSQLLLPNGRPVGLLNQSTVASGEIAADPQVRKLASELGSWIEKARSGGGYAKEGMFNRNLYVVPESPYDQMRIARTAVRSDDVVSNVAEATEALAFDGGLKWESANADEADVFNQLSADLNLDGKIREMWREVFTVDQFVCAKLWDTQTYTVRGTTDAGNKKKKRYTLYAPTRLTLLKPENVVPIGYGPLRNDDLAWQATPFEIGHYTDVIGSETLADDPLMSVFFTGQYKPGPDEQVELANWGINNYDRMLRMNPDWVFRHTSTRPDYAKFPDFRLRSIFDLLDLKRQLIASDRATLIGAANYILLIRKGSDQAPATQEEVNNLKANYNFLAKLPVIISDHRLEIDVIAPKLDFVLKRDAYEELNSRILARTLSTFVTTASSRGTNSADTFSDVLASAIQNRRHMIKRTLEREIARAIVEHPKNKDVFEERPSLVFTPRNVSVGTNQATLQAMLALRTQREISRDTILEFMGLDEATEAQRLELEERLYDDIFKTQVPFAAPGMGGPNQPDASTGPTGPSGPSGSSDSSGSSGSSGTPRTGRARTTPNGTPESPAVSGRRGGRPIGGGTPKQSPQGATKPRSRSGNTVQSSEQSSEEDDE